MRLLDERGRLWGLINPFDLLLIIGLVLLGWRTVNQLQPVAPNEQLITVTYGILVRNVPPYLAASIAIGQEVFQIKQQTFLGKVIDKEVTPAELLLTQNGQLLQVVSPVNFDLRLKICRSGRLLTGNSGSGIYLGKKSIRIGEKLAAQTRYSTFEGEIEYLRMKTDVP